VPAFQSNTTRMAGPLLSVALEPTGRGWVMGPLMSAASVEAVVWSPGRGFVSATTVGTGALGASIPTWLMGSLAPYPSCQVIYDGVGHLHQFYAPQSVVSRGLAIADLPLPLPSAISVPNREAAKGLFGTAVETISATSGATGHGFEVATDGQGTVMSVALEEPTSLSFTVIARSAFNGAWSSGAVTLSGDLPSGWSAVGPVPAPSPETRQLLAQKPTVVHLGSGRFLAAYLAANATTSEAAIYSRLYDPALGWQASTLVDQTFSWTRRPNIEGFSLFSNGAGGAGIAFHHLSTQSSNTTVAIDQDIRTLRVGRYRFGSGWGDFASADRPCAPGDSPAAPWDGRRAGCSQRPVGVLLPSGEAVILHPVSEGFRIRISAFHFR